MKYYNTEISWKGIGDYLSAARTISQHGTSNTSGPLIHCQGLALELALKYYLWDKNRAYPGSHDIEALAFEDCHGIKFSEEEIVGIRNLNRQYLLDGEFPYPARYRPSVGRVFVSISQNVLEMIITKIIKNTSHTELVKPILAR